MTDPKEQLQHLAQIRSMMERSTRFLSLSGLSGIAAGFIALLGAGALWAYLGFQDIDLVFFREKNEALLYSKWGIGLKTFMVLDAVIVLVLALASGYYFTSRKARQRDQRVWTGASRRLAVNLLLPLGAGGIYGLILLTKGHVGLVPPATLIFYGLALLNGSKYTLDDIRWLGISEIVLGLLASYFLGYGLLFWAIGFGVLHIIYGFVMYQKYEQ